MIFGPRAPLSPLRVILLAQPGQMDSSGTYLLRHQDRGSPAILVRMLLTAAGIDPRVAGYTAALAPDANERWRGQQVQSPVSDVNSRITAGSG